MKKGMLSLLFCVGVCGVVRGQVLDSEYRG